jgi:hypothetical protein
VRLGRLGAGAKLGGAYDPVTAAPLNSGVKFIVNRDICLYDRRAHGTPRGPDDLSVIMVAWDERQHGIAISGCRQS